MLGINLIPPHRNGAEQSLLPLKGHQALLPPGAPAVLSAAVLVLPPAAFAARRPRTVAAAIWQPPALEIRRRLRHLSLREGVVGPDLGARSLSASSFKAFQIQLDGLGPDTLLTESASHPRHTRRIPRSLASLSVVVVDMASHALI